MVIENGCIHIYTGNGKGKTTAALGLAMRACGSGMNVALFQFLKGSKTSELKILDTIENIQVYRGNDIKKFIWNMNEKEQLELKKQTQELFKKACEFAQNDNCSMLILDELLGAMTNKMISKDDVLHLISIKSPQQELVITGRNCPEFLIECADLVSEINPIKHYVDKGINARRGIEF